MDQKDRPGSRPGRKPGLTQIKNCRGILLFNPNLSRGKSGPIKGMQKALLAPGSVVLQFYQSASLQDCSKKSLIKGLIIMKLVLLLITASCLQAAASGYAQTINLSLKDARLEKVFKEIEKQTDYRFIYTKEQLSLTASVSIEVRNASIISVLDICLRGQPVSYSLQEPYVILKRNEERNPDQEKANSFSRSINGKVVDESGAGISSATVSIKGSTIATACNEAGEWRLEFDSEYNTLVVSSIGYRTKELTIDEKSFYNVVLERVVNSLDDMIVIGYGKTTRRLNTGSVSRVESETIEKQPVANFLGALQGRVPGLVITENSGVPGSSFKVQIRGQNSILQGTDPLFIIDGVPFLLGNNALNQVSTAASLSPFGLINPDDIESVEVLKDADATSIYGSRGANGVILITTKKGKVGKTNFKVDGYAGVSNVTRTMELLPTSDYLSMRREAFFNDGIAPSSSNAPDLFLWDTTHYIDLKDALTGGTANTTDLQFSVSGGNSSTRFLVGVGANKQTTVFPGDLSNKRATIHSNLHHETNNRKFFFDLSTNYGYNKNDLSSYDLSAAINMPPHIHLFDQNGNLNWKEGGTSFSSLGIINPLAYLYQQYTGKFNNLISNLQAGYAVAKDLILKASFGYNLVLGDEVRVNPSISLDPATNQLPFSYFRKRKQEAWIIEPQINYLLNLSKKVRLNLLAGGTWQSSHDELFSVDASNYSNDIQLKTISAAGSIVASNSFNEYRYNSLFGRANFNWDEKYLLNVSYRRDGSSRFGPGKQFSNFGSIGGAWIFSGEQFIREAISFLSFGKLRASYGTAGNDHIGNYQFIETWTNTNTTYQNIPGLIPSRLFNPDYSWELNRKFEGAIDLGFFKDRLFISAAYFLNRCSNQLVPYTLPIQTGFNSINKNLDALIENRGLEITLSGRIINNKSLVWTSTLNLTSQQNKLLEFPGLATSSYANTYVINEPLSVKKLYQYKGVDAATGVYQFNDVDGNGVMNNIDRVLLKNTDPKYYGGFENTIVWKGFQLNVFFEFRKQEGLNYLNTQSYNVPGYDYRNHPVVVLDRWQKPGDNSMVQKFTADFSSAAYTNASVYLPNSNAIYSDASFIRCKNVSLSYTIPEKLFKRGGLDILKLYLRCQNLFTITDYEGADPENQNLYVLPPLRTIVGGIQLTFK